MPYHPSLFRSIEWSTLSNADGVAGLGRQRRDVTDIDLQSRPFDNVENGIFGGVGWVVGILGWRKDVVSNEIGCKLGAHDFFEDF